MRQSCGGETLTNIHIPVVVGAYDSLDAQHPVAIFRRVKCRLTNSMRPRCGSRIRSTIWKGLDQVRQYFTHLNARLITGEFSCARRSRCAPLAFSVKMRSQPAAFSASVCNAGFWSSVETQAYPTCMTPPIISQNASRV
jgi:hypothetical protein